MHQLEQRIQDSQRVKRSVLGSVVMNFGRRLFVGMLMHTRFSFLVSLHCNAGIMTFLLGIASYFHKESAVDEQHEAELNKGVVNRPKSEGSSRPMQSLNDLLNVKESDLAVMRNTIQDLRRQEEKRKQIVGVT